MCMYVAQHDSQDGMIDIEKVIEGKESDWNWIVLLLDILDCYVLVKGKASGGN